MKNNFQIRSLNDVEFIEIFKMDLDELLQIGALRMKVDKALKYPCRVTLEDTAVGEEVILLNYQYHKTNSPYRAAGPVFVKVNSISSTVAPNEIPKFLNHRFLSLRAYADEGIMKEAMVIEGKDLREALMKLFYNAEHSYVHIHNARQGCYLCVAERIN